MEIRRCFLTKNDCFVRNERERTLPTAQQDSRYRRYFQGPTRIVVHSTGVNNPNLRRYVGPDDGRLGVNPYGNDWNRGGLDVCVNAFIGRLADGTVAVYQTLPWEYRPWGVGSGSKGSYNDCAIQFEICEDDHTSADYCRETYEAAAQLCAYLCRQYGIPVEGIVSHKEAHDLGYGSAHSDPHNWWPKFGLSMDGFRERVKRIIEEDIEKMANEEIRSICREEIAAAKTGEGTGNHPSKWAAEAAKWAVDTGIVSGFGGDDMGWQTLLTREQMAVMLYRFAKMVGKA